MPVATAAKYSRLIQICASIWTATLAVINVRHAAALSRAASPCSDTREAADQNRSPAMFAIAGLRGNGIWISTKEPCSVVSPPQPGPAPKRRRIASLNEDPVLAPPVEHAANDELSSAIRDFVHENWGSIRTHVVHGPIQTRYNHRFTTPDMRVLKEPLGELFDEQTTAFKVNLSFGFILKQKVTGRLRYYHSSNNCCGRYMEEPALITNRADFESFQERIQEPDLLNWAVSQIPNSDWVCEHVTNATFFLNRIVQHPIGCVGVVLPDYVKRNKAIVGLEKDHHCNATYNDNLCLFRCLALHQGCDVRRLEATVSTLYAKYSHKDVHDFTGVTLDDLSKIEAAFDVNVVVYKLVEITDGKTTVELVRRSPCQYIETMYLNLYEAHFSYIKDIRMYSHSYKCSKCEQALWKTPQALHRHERTCTEGIKRVYKGGVYHPHRLCLNAWTMKASLSKKRYGITPIVQHSISSVFSIDITYPQTLIRYNGRHATYR